MPEEKSDAVDVTQAQDGGILKQVKRAGPDPGGCQNLIFDFFWVIDCFEAGLELPMPLSATGL